MQLPLAHKDVPGQPAGILGRAALGGPQGVLPCQAIEDLIKRRVLKAQPSEIQADQVQPASIDLRLGPRGWRVRASFLPGKGQKVEERLKEFALAELSPGSGVVLERGCFYIFEVQEFLEGLPRILSAVANPKSSTGRLDVFARLIADNSEVFDWIESSYSGRLYVELCPLTFSIKVSQGSRLNQLRFLRRTSSQDRYERPRLDDKELREIHRKHGLTDGEPTIRNGLNVRVDLRGPRKGSVIGYRALRYAGVIDVEQRKALNRSDFWEPIRANKQGRLILNPNEFYILASKERIQVPANLAAEMAPIDPMMGEFRAHYAGFFDPGFGLSANSSGSKAVLEVRSHDVPFVLEDGQVIARLVYENLVDAPKRLYGRDVSSNYQGQGLKLSKHFK